MNYYYGGQYQQAAQLQNDNFIWVHGEDGMYNYPLPRNYTGVMFDADNDGVFYIKTTDVNGNILQRPRKFKFEEVQFAPQNVMSEVSVADFEALKKELAETKQLLEDLTAPKKEEA